MNNQPFNVLRHVRQWERAPRMPEMIATYLIKTAHMTAFTANVVAYVAYTAVTTVVLKALSPTPDFGASTRGLLVNANDPAAPHDYVYGEVRKGGIRTYVESTGAKNKFLHMIIAVAGHEIEEYSALYVNDEEVTLDGNGFVTDAKWNGKIRINKHKGDQTSADADLLAESTEITSDFVGNGIAYLYVRLEYDQDVFSNGIPLFTARVKGRKVVDPRVDTSTRSYSANAALCVRDYLTSDIGLNDAAVYDTSFAASANVSDEDVTLAAGGTQKRYEVNGVVSAGLSPRQVMDRMMTTCDGTLFWGQGNWQLKVAYYSAPVKTFTLDDLRGPIGIDTRVSARDNFNRVIGTFADADADYITSDYPPLESSTFLAEDDGVENTLNLELPLTTNFAAAQRLAKLTLFRAREQITVSASFGMEAFGVQVGDIIAFTSDRHGWSAKEFEVVGWKFETNQDAGDMQIGLTLRETSAAAFSWSGEETDIIYNNANLPSASDVPLPTLEAAVISTVVNEDGTAVPQILFRWSVSEITRVAYFDFQWKLSSQGVYQTAQVSGTEWTISPAISNSAYDYRVRAVNQAGYRSAFASSAGPASTGNDLTVPNPPTSLVAEGGYSTAKLTWTAPTTNTDASTIKDLFQYQIFRGTTTDPTTFVGRVSGESFTDGGLDDDTTYYYRVKAQDFTGNLSSYSTNGSVTTDVAPAGARGAGRWSIGVTSLPTTSSGANTDFVAAIGQPVDRDQAWFYTGTAASPTSQGVWLYDAGTPVWIEQDEVIDGNLLVTETVTANAIDADAITGKNVTVGTLTATTVPTGSEEGARIQSDGTMFVGDKSEYLRWDGSVLSINGEIQNLGDFNKTPYSGGWSAFTSSLDLGDRMDLLGGAGLYAIFMAGAGGSGSASGRTNSIATYACGGSSGAGAFFVFNYDGSDDVQFVSGSGGAGVTGGGSSSADNGVDGNSGGNSLFQVGGSTKVTCSGGAGGDASNSTATSGPSAPSTPSDSRITEFVGYAGGAGGSAVATGASGGGGLGLFYTSTTRGGNSSANNGTAGGGPFGQGGDTSTSSRSTGPAYPEDSDGFVIFSTPVKVVSSPAGYFSGGSGSLDVTDRTTGTDSTGFLGGRGSWNSINTATAGNGGFLAGGGGAVTTDDYVATAGNGGPAGGGGGANKSDNTAGDFPVSGDGGSGVILIKKL